MKNKNRFIVSCKWLAENLNAPEIAIVDASWYLPNVERNGAAEYEMQHIPGAVFFDIDAICEPNTGLPHSLANPELFAEAAGKMGISEDQTIVVYDGMGLFSASRVWWNFRVMGAKNVFILDGGFPQWFEDGLPVENKQRTIIPKVFTPQFREHAVVPFEGMLAAISSRDATIADARPTGRFTGEQAEPRAGMRSGHMPGPTSLPVTTLLENGRLRPVDELAAIFKDAGIGLDDHVITTCGSGVTAATLTLALESIGHKNHRLYDGSWSQWGGRDDTPVETG